MKEQHSSHLRTIGACLHQLLNLRNENLLSTPERQCTLSAKKDLSDAEMDTLTNSCSPTIVITANGEVQTHEEAIVYVKELDIFLTMKVLENTPAVLSLGKLCDENGYSYEWINGQKPHLIKKGIRIPCNTENFVLVVVPGLSSSSSGSSSTSKTPSKQESHSSSSSSSSSSSPTVSEIQIREREDAPNNDISPVPVSELVDDRSGKTEEFRKKKRRRNRKCKNKRKSHRRSNKDKQRKTEGKRAGKEKMQRQKITLKRKIGKTHLTKTHALPVLTCSCAVLPSPGTTESGKKGEKEVRGDQMQTQRFLSQRKFAQCFFL